MGYLIAGFGKFGRLALVRIKTAFPDSSIEVLDSYGAALLRDSSKKVLFHNTDAVSFLAEAHSREDDEVIVPMVPFHLLAAYILKKDHHCRTVPVPVDLGSKLPNPFFLDDANLCCSRADFICPDDCPEGDLCTVTGEPREPLYDLIEKIRSPGFTVLVQRSFQILPGVGGYTLGDLRRLQRRIERGKYLVATSCKCHGIVTAIEAGN